MHREGKGHACKHPVAIAISDAPIRKKHWLALAFWPLIRTFATMNEMPQLNLPTAPLRLKQEGAKTCVFDILRRRWIQLTPEEWVRQHFVHFLLAQRGYPQGLLANEVSLSLNQTKKRCDTVLYDNLARPRMIVEYKAPNIAISQRTFDQISRYNIVLRVPYLIVSNGLRHFCCRIDYERGTYGFLPDIPAYNEL